jgi:uncharacterized protein YjbJ (UPF0337 family)
VSIAIADTKVIGDGGHRTGHRSTLRARQKHKPGGTMTDKNVDEAKGRVKEAAGALTGDRHLKSEGHVDKAKASLKKTVDKVADTVKGEKHNRG